MAAPNTNYAFRITVFNASVMSRHTQVLPRCPSHLHNHGLSKHRLQLINAQLPFPGGRARYLQKIKQLRQIFDVLDDNEKDGTLHEMSSKILKMKFKNSNLAEF